MRDDDKTEHSVGKGLKLELLCSLRGVVHEVRRNYSVNVFYIDPA